MTALPHPSAAEMKPDPAFALPDVSASQEIARGRLMEAIVEHLPLGVSVFDADGSCLFANRAASVLAGPAPGEPPDTPAKKAVSSVVTETRVQAFSVADRHYALRTTQDVTERRQVERELFDRAFMDELTGLPNRALVQQTTEGLIARGGSPFALAFIDLDNFKHINDYYSHAVGDALLVKLAARLSDMLGQGDLAGRIGGDEFLLLLTPLRDMNRLQADLDAIIERLKQPFMIDGHEIFASASIGVSIFPEHGRSYDTLRRNADNAMYRAKSGVKGSVLLFDTSMAQAATARMALEQRLRLAIRDRRFCCAVQPKVDFRFQEVVGVEVLLRWRDEHGLIQAPGNFVELAVELGLMNDITHLVLEETVRVIDAIDDAFGSHVTISVNVAAKQAEDVSFMRGFANALAESGHAERFFIELTEEAFVSKSRFQTEVLPLLRSIGARISIDDFGVGYSSLAALADITADEIKIDRSFITEIHRRPRSQCVLRAIESLSQGLGMSIIAEGVETFEELAYLQTATRIHHAQGFYFARPMLLELLSSQMPAFDSRGPVASRDPIVLRGGSQRLIGSRSRA